MQLSDEEWKQKLTPEQFAVLRQKGTDAPFEGKYVDNHDAGVYACAACGTELFNSETKFDSGSGWPSFYDMAKSGVATLIDDDSHGTHRTEVVCANCGGHLGHLFPDAPQTPTGQRFCINSASLDFMPQA